MATYPTDGSSPGTWGAECSAYHAVSTDLATGKIKVDAEKESAMTGSEGDRVVIDKGYVSGDDTVFNDSLSATMVNGGIYLAQTAGFVTSFINVSSTGSLEGFFGTTSNPTTRIAFSRVQSNPVSPSISFFVAKGNYFKVTLSSGTPVITWTPFVADGANPIKQ